MTTDEKKKMIKRLDKLTLDSKNLMNEALKKAETNELKTYLERLMDERAELLEKLDKQEMDIRSDIEDKESVGGSMQHLWVKDTDFDSDEAILREVLRGEQDVLEAFEEEMSKPVSDDLRALLDEAARTLIRNTETMKRMIESNDIKA